MQFRIPPAGIVVEIGTEIAPGKAVVKTGYNTILSYTMAP